MHPCSMAMPCMPAQKVEEMKTSELKEELQCRGKPCSGPKPLLLRRLHAAIMCEIASARGDESDSDEAE